MKKIKLKIKNEPLNRKMEKRLIRKIIEPLKGYGNISDSNLEKIEKYLKKIQDESYRYYDLINYPLTIQLIKSIRSAYLKEKLISNHKNLYDKNNKRIIIDMYKNKKKSLIDIADKFDISPLTVFRFLMKEKYGQKKYHKIKKNFEKYLNERDIKEMKKGIDNDIIAPFDHSKTLERSLEFEEVIGKFLTSNNVKYKTQEQLVEEQTKKFGKPINTPDFLILDELYINDNLVKWIDAKNFYGADTFLIKKNLKKQTKKYLDKWGPGVILFGMGYSSKLVGKYKNIMFINYLTLHD